MTICVESHCREESAGREDLVGADEEFDEGSLPWALSFSFGRALQAPVLRAWAGLTLGYLVAARDPVQRGHGRAAGEALPG